MDTYKVRVRSVGSDFDWVLTCGEEELCFSPKFKTETKALIEALFFGTIFGVDVVLPEDKSKPRHLRLVTDQDTSY